MSEGQREDRATVLHHAALVFDGHCDTVLRILDGRCRFAERSDEGHVDLPRLREGGVDAQIFAGCVGGPGAERPLVAFLRMADALLQEIDAHPDALRLARRAADIEAAKAAGQVACILSMEGAEPLEGELAMLRTLHRLGLRNLGLVWSGRNALGSGVFGEGIDDAGLSAFGRQVVREANRLGVMIDVSHLNERGFWDVIEVAERPIVASHSNARALFDHPRNLWDEQIRAIAATGGLVGVVFTFLTEPREVATLEHVLAQIDYMVELVGPGHVGLGSDFDGIRHPPAGLEDVSKLDAITEGLLARGYAEEDIRKILGLNWLRVFREAVG